MEIQIIHYSETSDDIIAVALFLQGDKDNKSNEFLNSLDITSDKLFKVIPAGSRVSLINPIKLSLV
jgi:hypothetical protein